MDAVHLAVQSAMIITAVDHGGLKSTRWQAKNKRLKVHKKQQLNAVHRGFCGIALVLSYISRLFTEIGLWGLQGLRGAGAWTQVEHIWAEVSDDRSTAHPLHGTSYLCFIYAFQMVCVCLHACAWVRVCVVGGGGGVGGGFKPCDVW